MVTAVALALTVIFAVPLLWMMKHPTDAETDPATVGPVPGLGVTTTSPSGDFELAGPRNPSGVTTLPPGAIPTTESTTTVPQTTTTLPGSASPDGVCRSMSALYDSSRQILERSMNTSSLAIYSAGVQMVRTAVDQDDSADLIAIRPQLLALIDRVIGVLGQTDDPPGALQESYDLLTDLGDPAVATMMTHLRNSCPNLALTLEVGLT